MQPSKPQPFRLPQRFDSPTLAKYAIPGEPTVIVRAVGVGSTAPFEYSDRNGRQAIFRYEREYDAHVLKVPASVWNHNKGFMAHELMDQRRLPHPLVITVEVPTKPNVCYRWLSQSCDFNLSNEIGIEVALNGQSFFNKAALPPCNATLIRSIIQRLDDWKQHVIEHGDLPPDLETVSKSQDGQEAKSSGPYPENAGASPAPATTSPKMDAPGNSEEASDVVVGQVSEQPGASATFSSVAEELNAAASQAVTQSIEESINGNAPAPLYSRAWDMLESPMRLKELAAVLETEPDTLKASIQEPLSAVELGHAGWVKRREPQA